MKCSIDRWRNLLLALSKSEGFYVEYVEVECFVRMDIGNG